MPSRCAPLLLLVGCNQVFAIEPTELDNDAPIDPMCPSDGVSGPVFRSDVREIVGRECFMYTTSEAAGRALAVCTDRGTGATLETGPIDEDALEPIQITREPADVNIGKAWLAPSGDELLVHQNRVGGTTSHWLTLYERSGSAWAWRAHVTESDMFITGGMPSATPERRVFNGSFAGYRELAERDGTWQEVRSGPWTELGIDGGIADYLNLSPDGLRLTFASSLDAYFTDRPSLDVGFRPAVKLDVGQVRGPFLVESCGKLYFSGLSSVFYRYQL